MWPASLILVSTMTNWLVCNHVVNFSLVSLNIGVCIDVFWCFTEKFGSSKVDDELIARIEKVTGKPGMLIVQLLHIIIYTHWRSFFINKYLIFYFEIFDLAYFSFDIKNVSDKKYNSQCSRSNCSIYFQCHYTFFYLQYSFFQIDHIFQLTFVIL